MLSAAKVKAAVIRVEVSNRGPGRVSSKSNLGFEKQPDVILT